MLVGPGAPQKTINDLIPDVQDALQQRGDVAALVPKYMKRAIQEITESYPFEELRTTGPTVSLTAKKPTYLASFFLNTGDDYTVHSSFALFVDFPNNTVVSPVTYKTPAAIEVMLSPATIGVPSKWTRYGQNIFLGPNPDKNYSVFFRYQRRHPFSDSDNAGSSVIYLPDSWEEIVVYSTAERIAVIKRWNDQAKYLHDILYGDPEFQSSEGKRGRPGLIAARLFQQERDEQMSSRQLMVMVPRYCQH